MYEQNKPNESSHKNEQQSQYYDAKSVCLDAQVLLDYAIHLQEEERPGVVERITTQLRSKTPRIPKATLLFDTAFIESRELEEIKNNTLSKYPDSRIQVRGGITTDTEGNPVKGYTIDAIIKENRDMHKMQLVLFPNETPHAMSFLRYAYNKEEITSSRAYKTALRDHQPKYLYPILRFIKELGSHLKSQNESSASRLQATQEGGIRIRNAQEIMSPNPNTEVIWKNE